MRHIYICDYHKNVIQNVRNKRKHKDSEMDGDSPDLDFDLPEVSAEVKPRNRVRYASLLLLWSSSS